MYCHLCLQIQITKMKDLLAVRLLLLETCKLIYAQKMQTVITALHMFPEQQPEYVSNRSYIRHIEGHLLMALGSIFV